MDDSSIFNLWGFRHRRTKRILATIVSATCVLAVIRHATDAKSGSDYSDWSIVKHTYFGERASSLSTAHKPREWLGRLPIPDSPLPQTPLDASTESHVFRTDGLVQVSSTSPKHPITQLIQDGKQKWADKLGRQSKSLSQAVKEYQRRYNRLPPRGFDIWWNFIIENNVPLPDEYDQINRDIEPFFGISPPDLQWLQTRSSNQHGTFTLSVENGRASIAKVSVPQHDMRWAQLRAEERLELLDDVAELLPDLNITFTAHDPPLNFIHHELKERLHEAVREGTFIDIDFPSDSEPQSWAAACPPSSPLYAAMNSVTRYDPFQPFTSHPKSFIHSHVPSMDPCVHSTHPLNTGLLLGPKTPIPHEYMAPTFGMSSSLLHVDILSPTLEHFRLAGDGVDETPWTKKADNRLLWRGRSTGLWARNGEDWANSQRQRLVGLFQTGHNETTDARVISVLDPDEDGRKMPIEVSATELNIDLMDVAFGDKPVQCDPEVCDEMEKEFRFIHEGQTYTEAYKYRYVLDVDGNGWSARYKRLLQSQATILKATIHPEWFSDRIQPWVHFVPVKVDFSDLYDIMAYFRGIKTSVGPGDNSGKEERRGSHEDLAEEIAKAGTAWSEKFWRREDMDAYGLRLMLEYARVISDDRDAMSFVYNEAIHGDPALPTHA